MHQKINATNHHAAYQLEQQSIENTCEQFHYAALFGLVITGIFFPFTIM